MPAHAGAGRGAAGQAAHGSEQMAASPVPPSSAPRSQSQQAPHAPPQQLPAAATPPASHAGFVMVEDEFPALSGAPRHTGEANRPAWGSRAGSQKGGDTPP